MAKKKKIRMTELDKTLNQILKEYADEVTQDTKEVVDLVTEEALKVTKKHAPVDKRNTSRKGKYKRSLKRKTLYESLTEKRNVIYASGDEYRLTHLLEKGHANINGKRTKGQPHFYYGDNLVKEDLLKEIEKKIGGK